MAQPIRSDDPQALEKLKGRLELLKTNHQKMKEENEHYRKNGTMRGFGDLTDEKATQLDAQIANSYQKVLHSSYDIQYSNQDIRRLEGRIKSLESERNREASVYDTQHLGFTVEENKEIKRLQLRFEDKPEKSVQALLHHNGFVYSHRYGSWQRLLNDSARNSLRWLIRSMEKAAQKTSEPEM